MIIKGYQNVDAKINAKKLPDIKCNVSSISKSFWFLSPFLLVMTNMIRKAWYGVQQSKKQTITATKNWKSQRFISYSKQKIVGKICLLQICVSLIYHQLNNNVPCILMTVFLLLSKFGLLDWVEALCRSLFFNALEILE